MMNDITELLPNLQAVYIGDWPSTTPLPMGRDVVTPLVVCRAEHSDAF